jgi:hypothetical protein
LLAAAPRWVALRWQLPSAARECAPLGCAPRRRARTHGALTRRGRHRRRPQSNGGTSSARELELSDALSRATSAAAAAASAASTAAQVAAACALFQAQGVPGAAPPFVGPGGGFKGSYGGGGGGGAFVPSAGVLAPGYGALQPGAVYDVQALQAAGEGAARA